MSANLSSLVLILHWKALDPNIVDIILGASRVDRFIRIEGHVSRLHVLREKKQDKHLLNI